MPRIAWIATGRPSIVSWRRPARVGPGLFQHDRLVEGDLGDLGGDAADRLGRHAAARGDRLGRVFRRQVAVGQQGKGWPRRPPIGKLIAAEQGRIDIDGLGIDEAIRRRSKASGLPSASRANRP